MISHQPKVQRLFKRGYGTSCEMLLLRLTIVSVAYSSWDSFFRFEVFIQSRS